MSIQCEANLNPLYPGNFGLTIESGLFSNVEYFCTEINLPGLTMTPDNPMSGNYEHYVAADTIRYGSLSCTFTVDEEMKNYLEIHNWCVRLQTGEGGPNEIYDGALIIKNNKGNVNKTVRFKGLIPQALGELSFSVSESSEPVSCTVDFAFSGFEFE